MPNVRITHVALRLLRKLAKAGRRPMTAELERVLVAESEGQQFLSERLARVKAEAKAS